MHITGIKTKMKISDPTANGKPDQASPDCMPTAYSLANVGPATIVPSDCVTDMALYKVATYSGGTNDVATLMTAIRNGSESDMNSVPMMSGAGAGAMKTKKYPTMPNMADTREMHRSFSTAL